MYSYPSRLLFCEPWFPSVCEHDMHSFLCNWWFSICLLGQKEYRKKKCTCKWMQTGRESFLVASERPADIEEGNQDKVRAFGKLIESAMESFRLLHCVVQTFGHPLVWSLIHVCTAAPPDFEPAKQTYIFMSLDWEREPRFCSVWVFRSKACRISRALISYFFPTRRS